MFLQLIVRVCNIIEGKLNLSSVSYKSVHRLTINTDNSGSKNFCLCEYNKIALAAILGRTK